VIDLRKKINFSISLLPDINSGPNGVILDLPISIPQGCEFEEGEELVDLSSLQFSELAPNPSLLIHSTSINYDHLSNAPKPSLSISFVITYSANDWACDFDKLKWALTFIDASLFSYFSHIHFSELCSKSYDRLLRALMSFDRGCSLRLK